MNNFMKIPILSNIFSKGAKDILDSGKALIDTVTTSDEEKTSAKNKLTEIVLNGLNQMQDAQKEVILAEAKGTWLQRNWRPITMLSFTFIIVYAYFIEPAFLTTPNPISESLNPNFWSLLKIGLGGYVVGRSVEKVSNTVTKNVDLPFFKKKRQKNLNL